jgi:CRP/FNR family transcriptional regulator, cyclic AMP receptor protein
MPSRPESRRGSSAADRLGILRRHPLFGALEPQLIERLASYAAMRSFERGETVFVKNDPGNSLYAVCSGTVKISAPSAEGKDAVFNMIGEGEIFGEIALLDGRPRTADAIAATDCALMVIERRDFIDLVRTQPEIALKLMEVLCARLRHTSEQVEDVLFLDLPARLAKTLLHLSHAAQKQGGDITLTQREIGQMIGMSRESTNKQLREWQQRHWVRLDRGRITVLAPDALAALTEER